MKSVKLSVLLGLLLALWLGADPNLVTASYPILIDLVRTMDSAQMKKPKKLCHKKEDK
jgi:hypothetical protein